jgi:hypothetical protein
MAHLSVRWGTAAGWIILSVLLSLALQAESQGLVSESNTILSSTAVFQKLSGVWKKARQYKARYQARPPTKCSGKCPLSSSAEDYGWFLMATSPVEYDSRNPSHTGGFNAVSPARNQSLCNSCVAFSVISAAESAAAAALNRDATSSSISEQDFFFCRASSNSQERSCGSGLSVKDGMQEFVDLHAKGEYVVTRRCLPYNPNSNTLCWRKCGDVDPMQKQGSFSFVPLTQAWDVQTHIRQFGAVVTRLDLYPNFKPFFAKNPKGVYPGPGELLMELRRFIGGGLCAR